MEGAGTAENPYLVETAEDLNNVRNDLRAHYKQISDIDLSEFDNWEPINNENTYSSSDESTHVNLVYDGQEYRILNLTISNKAEYDIYYYGLFGELNTGSSDDVVTLKNITLKNVSIQGVDDGSVGGILAWAYMYGGKATIENCRVSGTVEGEWAVGGVLGALDYNQFIKDCTFVGTVSGETEVGGLCGLAASDDNPEQGDYSSIINCESHGEIYGIEWVGGLIGDGGYSNYDPSYYKPYIFDSHSTMTVRTNTEISSTWVQKFGGFAGGLYGGGIQDCYATGDVIAEYPGVTVEKVGGFAGQYEPDTVEQELKRCYATGKAKGDENVGGFIGEYTSGGYNLVESFSLLDCYARGTVIGYSNVGGFLGSRYWVTYGGEPQDRIIAKIKNCYSANKVIGNVNTGGFVGSISEAYQGDLDEFCKECYYDEDLSGYSDTGKGKPRTTEEMTKPYNEDTTYIGWDFDNVWFIVGYANDGYPIFEYHPDLEGETLYFTEVPQVSMQPPTANSVTVESETNSYTATKSNVSQDRLIERKIKIEEGDAEVCEKVAKRLLRYWSKEKKSVTGPVRLSQGMSFKRKVRVVNNEADINDLLILQKQEHDVIAQETVVTCGDIILDDNELLARIIDDVI